MRSATSPRSSSRRRPQGPIRLLRTAHWLTDEPNGGTLRPMDMRPRSLVVAVLLVSGCSSPAKTTVTGVLEESGGPRFAGQPGVRGHVVFQGDGKAFSATAASDGTFSLSLPRGHYEVTGTSPLYNSGKGTCRSNSTVTVGQSRVRGVVVVCSLK